jgi:hypothetical protein
MNILQNIFSIKNEGMHKVCTILGLKIKIKTKLNSLKVKLDKLEKEHNIQIFSFYNGNHFVKCTSLEDAFIRQIDSEVFYEICRKYFQFRDLSEYYPHEILIYIVSCLDTKKNEEAKNLLTNYVDLYGTSEICRFLPVARFAKAQGITDKNIEKSVIVFEELENSRKNKLFEKLLEGKSVAIVGNGPSEIGKGKGSQIDSHDIVIRFNNYKTSGYEKDYGSKTNIWARGSGGSDVINRKNHYDLVTWEADYSHWNIRYDFLDVMYNQIKSGQSIYNFNYKNHKTLRQASNVDFPTTGMVLIWEIYQKLGLFKNIDFYGFNFCQENTDIYATHYFKDRDYKETQKRSEWHSLDKEAIFLKKLIGDNR